MVGIKCDGDLPPMQDNMSEEQHKKHYNISFQSLSLKSLVQFSVVLFTSNRINF